MYSNIAGYSFLAVNEQSEDEMEVSIDLSEFQTVIQTTTHYPFISKKLQPGEHMFMFHARITDVNFKQPLKPHIQVKVVNEH